MYVNAILLSNRKGKKTHFKWDNVGQNTNMLLKNKTKSKNLDRKSMWMPVKCFLELPGSIKHHQSSHTVHPMQNCDHLWLMTMECASPQHYLPGSWPSGPWEYGNTPEHTALHRSSIPARRRSILKQATMSHHFTKTDSILLEKSIMNNEAGRSAKPEIVLILYIAFP